jgi:GT2 family glycosyltransferase
MKSTKEPTQVKKEAYSLSEADYDNLFDSVKNYEERIKEIEDSTYWRIYLFFTKAKLILTSDSYLKSDKWKFLQRIRFIFSSFGLFLVVKFFKQLLTLLFGNHNFGFQNKKSKQPIDYEEYKAQNFPRESDIELMRNNLQLNHHKPQIQLQVWVDKQNFKYLNRFLHALEDQIYENYNVSFIAYKSNEIVSYTLDKIAENDTKINVIYYKDGDDMPFDAQQDFVVFCKLNCILLPHFLYHLIAHIQQNGETEFIYCDNDFYKNSETSEDPYFKPGWSPHTLLSRNYVGQLFIVKKELIERVKLPSFSNFYSMILHLTHEANHISRIQKILYHYKQEAISIDRIKNQHRALNQYLSYYYPGSYAKLSEKALGCFIPVFKLKENALVSIIIPAKDKSQILEACINSILTLSTYQNFEIIVIDNGSKEPSFFSTLAQYECNYPEKIRSLRLDIPFNYSLLNNKAAKIARGEYLLFMNNDTKLISANLIEELVRLAQLENVGAVGPKLLYPNKTIQHAGIVLSIDETGAHVFSGSHKDTSGYFNNTNCLTNYSAVTGACMMIQKEKFDMVGGFDTQLAVDCNDVELCCRLQIIGYHNVYVPWVSMYHYECLTRGNPMLSSQSMLRQRDEKDYFTEKWGDMIKNDPYYNKNLSKTSKTFQLRNA